jgi:hypothetical protein
MQDTEFGDSAHHRSIPHVVARVLDSRQKPIHGTCMRLGHGDETLYIFCEPGLSRHTLWFIHRLCLRYGGRFIEITHEQPPNRWQRWWRWMFPARKGLTWLAH